MISFLLLLRSVDNAASILFRVAEGIAFVDRGGTNTHDSSVNVIDVVILDLNKIHYITHKQELLIPRD